MTYIVAHCVLQSFVRSASLTDLALPFEQTCPPLKHDKNANIYVMGRLKTRYTSLCSKQCVDWVSLWIGWLRMHCGETLNRLRRSYFLAGFVTLLSCHRLELTELENWAVKNCQSIKKSEGAKEVRSVDSRYTTKDAANVTIKHCKMVCLKKGKIKRPEMTWKVLMSLGSLRSTEAQATCLVWRWLAPARQAV